MGFIDSLSAVEKFLNSQAGVLGVGGQTSPILCILLLIYT